MTSCPVVNRTRWLGIFSLILRIRTGGGSLRSLRLEDTHFSWFDLIFWSNSAIYVSHWSSTILWWTRQRRIRLSSSLKRSPGNAGSYRGPWVLDDKMWHSSPTTDSSSPAEESITSSRRQKAHLLPERPHRIFLVLSDIGIVSDRPGIWFCSAAVDLDQLNGERVQKFSIRPSFRRIISPSCWGDVSRRSTCPIVFRTPGTSVASKRAGKIYSPFSSTARAKALLLS